MYVVASGLKIYACLEPTDMRRSFDGRKRPPEPL
jgi:hypothetical protein